MPSLQIRDIPEEIYQALAERARLQRRSMAQQAVTELARIAEYESRARRQSVIEELRQAPRRPRRGAVDLVRLLREERER